MKRGLSTHLECLTAISGPRLLSKPTRATSKNACRSPVDSGAENKLPLVQVPMGSMPGQGAARAMRCDARAKKPFNERRLPSQGMAASETSGWSSSLTIELADQPLVGRSRPVLNRSRAGRLSDDVARLVDGGEQDIGGGSQVGIVRVESSTAGETVGQRQHLGDGQQ